MSPLKQCIEMWKQKLICNFLLFNFNLFMSLANVAIVPIVPGSYLLYNLTMSPDAGRINYCQFLLRSFSFAGFYGFLHLDFLLPSPEANQINMVLWKERLNIFILFYII